MSRVKTGICGPHHDIRRQVSGDKYKARVLTKAQDDAKLLNIFESACSMGTPTVLLSDVNRFITRMQHFSTTRVVDFSATRVVEKCCILVQKIKICIFYPPVISLCCLLETPHVRGAAPEKANARAALRGDFQQQSGWCLGRRSCACPGGASQADKQALTPGSEWLRGAKHISWREGEGERARERERKRERNQSSERERGGGEITPRLRCPLCARATQPRWASVASEAGCHTGARPDTQRARVWHDARACSARSLCDFSKSGMASSASPSYSPQKPMSLMSDANNSMDSFALDDVDATVGIMVWPGKRKRWGRRRAQRRMCAFVPERMTR